MRNNFFNTGGALPHLPQWTPAPNQIQFMITFFLFIFFLLARKHYVLSSISSTPGSVYPHGSLGDDNPQIKHVK